MARIVLATVLCGSPILLQSCEAFVRPLVWVSSHAASSDLRHFSGRLRSSWYDDDTPATPSKKKKKNKNKNKNKNKVPAASGESFADREERKAVKKWEKLQVKKEVQRTRRKRHRGHGKDGTMSEYLNEGKGGSGVRKEGGVDAGGKSELGVELSPWEQPVVGVAGGAEGGALRLRRKTFNVNEVRGFNFVGGRCVGACLAAYFLLYCYRN